MTTQIEGWIIIDDEIGQMDYQVMFRRKQDAQDAIRAKSQHLVKVVVEPLSE